MSTILKSKKVIIAAVLAILVIIVAIVTITASGNRADPAEQLSLGNKFLAELKYEEAILAFEKVLKVDPMNTWAYIGLADAYTGKGDTDKAMEILKQGMEKTGDNGISKKIEEAAINDSNAVVIWSDPVLEKMVRMAMDKPIGDIMAGELGEIDELYILGESHATIDKPIEGASCRLGMYWVNDVEYFDSGTITKLDDLKYFSNLKKLQIAYNSISDISALIDLQQLTVLQLQNNKLTDISKLSQITTLTELNLCGNRISDITSLKDLIGLQSLIINNWVAQENQATTISDISAIAYLINLKSLNLTCNEVYDLSPLSGLTQLEQLYLDYNPIADWSPVSHIVEVIGRPQ